MSTVTAIPGARMSVVGDRGALVVDTGDRQEDELVRGARPGDPGYADRPEAQRPRLVVDGRPVEAPATAAGGYVDLYRELAAHLRGEGPNPVDPASSLAVVTLLESLHHRFPLDG